MTKRTPTPRLYAATEIMDMPQLSGTVCLVFSTTEDATRMLNRSSAFEAMRMALQQAAIVIRGIPVEQRVGVPGIARIIRAALALAEKDRT